MALVAGLKAKFYGHRVDGTDRYRDLIRSELGAGGVIVDIGAGRGNRRTAVKDRARLSIALDPSDAIQSNDVAHARVQANGYALPFRDQTVDGVTLDYVVEHLETPSALFFEVRRVLKIGGKMIVRTPNRFHYVALGAALTPHRFHASVAHRLRAQAGRESLWPTYYRANSPGRLRELLHRSGFRVGIEMVEAEPSYLAFAAPAFLLGVAYERVVNSTERLGILRSNMFAVATRM
jgi:ubiquinone/menaquinone biosynthesis C-methylase UbiE